MNKKVVKDDSIDVILKNVGLLIQCVLFVLLVIFAIISLINEEFFIVLQVIITLLMLVIAYNNYKIYKRKGFTILGIIVALMVIISIIVGLINGK